MSRRCCCPWPWGDWPPCSPGAPWTAIPEWPDRLCLPPGWVFPVAWTLLYILMGIASYIVASSSVSRERKERALCVYALQLAVNFAWPVIFFKLSAYGAAFFWLLLLLLLVLANELLFKHISKTAGKLLLPYLLWLLFALYLNLGVWILN